MGRERRHAHTLSSPAKASRSQTNFRLSLSAGFATPATVSKFTQRFNTPNASPLSLRQIRLIKRSAYPEDHAAFLRWNRRLTRSINGEITVAPDFSAPPQGFRFSQLGKFVQPNCGRI
jgi:hypothetical protein